MRLLSSSFSTDILNFLWTSKNFSMYLCFPLSYIFYTLFGNIHQFINSFGMDPGFNVDIQSFILRFKFLTEKVLCRGHWFHNTTQFFEILNVKKRFWLIVQIFYLTNTDFSHALVFFSRCEFLCCRFCCGKEVSVNHFSDVLICWTALGRKILLNVCCRKCIAS